MRTFNIILVFLALFTTVELNAQQPDNKYFDSVAEDMCNCIQPLLDAAELMEKYEAAGETEKMDALADKLEKDLEGMGVCISKLEKKYPELDEDDSYSELAMESLKEICPEFYQIMKAEEESSGRNENVSPNNNGEIYEAAAVDFCECAEPFFDTVEALENAKKKGKKKKIKSLEKQLEKELDKMEDCADAIDRKYPNIDLNDENKTLFVKALERNCDYLGNK